MIVTVDNNNTNATTPSYDNSLWNLPTTVRKQQLQDSIDTLYSHITGGLQQKRRTSDVDIDMITTSCCNEEIPVQLSNTHYCSLCGSKNQQYIDNTDNNNESINAAASRYFFYKMTTALSNDVPPNTFKTYEEYKNVKPDLTAT